MLLLPTASSNRHPQTQPQTYPHRCYVLLCGTAQDHNHCRVMSFLFEQEHVSLLYDMRMVQRNFSLVKCQN